MTARHLTASAIVLGEADQVLLIYHLKSGGWLYPGGHVEPGEDPAQAAVRETEEETGVRASILSGALFTHPAIITHPVPFAVIEMRAADPVAGPHQHVDFLYVCRASAASHPVPRPGEATAARWVPVSDMAGLDVPPELPGLAEHAIRWAAALSRPDGAPTIRERG